MSKITLLQNYDKPILLENASEGWVYKISDNHVVKVAARERYKRDMFHEIKITRLLYSFGISVPEPMTCDYVNVRGKDEIGYIMEYVEGISWDDNNISEEDNVLAKNLLNQELKLISNLGFSLQGDAPQWIFTKDKKIKLIDFTKWNYKRL
tara:strand:+ start:84 stop:536 length:453 start_codon:yes stop_codon:yes gene_type:complete